MEQTARQIERYIFTKPLWRKVMPTMLLIALWLPSLFIWKGALLPWDMTPFPNAYAQAMERLELYGVRLMDIVVASGAISFLLLWWLYMGFEKLVVTAEAITRRLPFGIRRGMRWVDVDEVMIDQMEARMEGDATARKTLILYSVPSGLFRRRRCLRIRNRQFDGYEDMERIAIQVSVPAVAARLRHRIEVEKKPALFPVRERGEALLVLTFFLGGVALLAGAAYEPIWTQMIDLDFEWIIRPALAVAALMLLLWSFASFLYRQVGVDMENLYLFRRRWIMRKVPIDNIADIQIRDNQMRIFAYTRDPEIPRQIFKSGRFVRNRGVLLRLIREIYEHRRLQDSAPIPAARALDMPPVTEA